MTQPAFFAYLCSSCCCGHLQHPLQACYCMLYSCCYTQTYTRHRALCTQQLHNLHSLLTSGPAAAAVSCSTPCSPATACSTAAAAHFAFTPATHSKQHVQCIKQYLIVGTGWAHEDPLCRTAHSSHTTCIVCLPLAQLLQRSTEALLATLLLHVPLLLLHNNM
jgi:hypothetical protein